MKYMKFLTSTAFFITTSASADLWVVPNEVDFGDVYKDCSSEVVDILIYWCDPNDPAKCDTEDQNYNPDFNGIALTNFAVSMTGNSSEFVINSDGCPSVLKSGDGCTATIKMKPIHYGVKKKKLNFDGSYDTGSSMKNDVSYTIPVTGTSYPLNNPQSDTLLCD